MTDAVEPDRREKLSDAQHAPAPSIPAAPRLWVGILAWMVVGGILLTYNIYWPWYSAPVILLLVASWALDRAPRVRRIGLPILVVLCATTIIISLAEATLGAVGGAGLVVLLISRRARTWLFAPFNLDPGSAVHAVSAAIYVTAIALLTAQFIEWQELPGKLWLPSLKHALFLLLNYGCMTLAGIGFLLHRHLRAALARLDLRPVSIRQVGWSAVVAAVFFVVTLLMNSVEGFLFPDLYALEDRFSWDVSKPSLLAASMLISLSAGIGEEALFRGALQPRFGIVATALLFTATHTHYQLPGLFILFLQDLAIGIIKQRTSTTFVACVHAFYDVAFDLFYFWVQRQ